nr:DUF4132 domain-containing protein [uncultured Acetatifactor sp.]
MLWREEKRVNNKEGEKFEEMLKLLELTPKNWELAEAYMDMSAPEKPELLKEVEHQDFYRLELGTLKSVYNTQGMFRRIRPELAVRFTRFVVEAGGMTARRLLAYYGWDNDFQYLKDILSHVQNVGLYADWVAWNTSAQKESTMAPLIEEGKKNPGIFFQIRDLCYYEDARNTEMFLAGLYLHCVKPPEESRSLLWTFAENDDRAEDSPERIREMRELLEKRLKANASGLFAKADEPQGEEDEKLRAFVQDFDPREEFPYEMRAMISGRKRHDYRMGFLPCLAFLGIEHSNRFISLIRFAVAVDGDAIPNLPLDACEKTGKAWFLRHIEALEKYLWIPEETYIRWAIAHREKEILMRMTAQAPDAVCQVIGKVPAEDYGYLLYQMKTGNPALYEKVGRELEADYRRISAEQDVKGLEPAGDRARDYLLGIIELEDILPYAEQWREKRSYDSGRAARIHDYPEYGEMQLYRRALVLECLRQEDAYFKKYWVEEGLPELANSWQNSHKNEDRRQIEGMLRLLEGEGVPAQYQISYFAAMYEAGYSAKVFDADSASQICVNALKELRGGWHSEWEETAKSKSLPERVLAYRVMGERWEEYKESLLSAASESAKQGREFLRGIYTSHQELEGDILEMLKSPKGGMREMAVEVLKNWGVEKYKEQLEAALGLEKSKKIKTLIQGILNLGAEAGGNQADGSALTLEDKIKEILGGGRKRKLAWLEPEGIGTVHKTDGQEASEDYMAAVLLCYADMPVPGVNQEVRRLTDGLKPEELAAYMGLVFGRWMEDGAQAKRKWVLYAASIHGGEAIVPVLYHQIQEWPQHARGAMAAEAVKALALNGTSTALLLVDQTARKFKFRQVKAAAAEALDYAAEQLGISREELEDRIVPSLGFDARMERIFDYGKRQFKVLLAPDLSLEVYDGNGKLCKSMPSPGKTDDPEKAREAHENWKLLKKQLKTVVANQKIRLEQALRVERQWEAGKWRALFVENPIMHQFAIGLVWGMYEEGALRETFRYMEDGTFNTAQEEEYELPQTGSIGLVHPIELTEEELGAWKEQMADYEIVQPIEQLERPGYRVTEEEKENTELVRFGGMSLNGLSLSGKLQDMGWYKGEVGDGGVYCTFFRDDRDKGVELAFSGSYVGGENETVVVYDAYFYRPGETEKAGWQYRPVRKKLAEVDPRYFSEVVLQLTRATASSDTRLKYPDCREW